MNYELFTNQGHLTFKCLEIRTLEYSLTGYDIQHSTDYRVASVLLQVNIKRITPIGQCFSFSNIYIFLRNT